MLKHPRLTAILSREWLIFLLLLVWVGLLRWPSLHQPFENDSGAIAYHARLIVQGEPLYGTHHPGHHLPGAYYTYALAFLLLGVRVASVKLLLIGWLALTVFLIYRLGGFVTNRYVGLLAAVLAAVLFSHVSFSGTSARIELFVVLPQVAAVLVLLRLMREGGRPWKFAFVGALGAVAFLFKASYIAPLLLAGLLLLVDLWPQRRSREAVTTFIKRGLWLGAGAAVVLLPVFLYFAALGLLPRFWLVFTIGRQYLDLRAHPTLSGPHYMLIYPLAVLALNNTPILMGALAAVIFLILGRGKEEPTATGMGAVAVWFGLEFVETNISRAFLLHYYLVFVPSLTLLAAWFVDKLYRDIRQRIRPERQAREAAMFVILIFFLQSVALNAPFYAHYGRYLLGWETHDAFLIAGLPGNFGRAAVHIQKLADYISARTGPDDTVYYWSNFMEFYFMAGRRSPVDIIWPIYATATGSPERIFEARYIIIGSDDMVGIAGRPEWLEQGLAENYVLETTLYGEAVYRRRGR